MYPNPKNFLEFRPWGFLGAGSIVPVLKVPTRIELEEEEEGKEEGKKENTTRENGTTNSVHEAQGL